MRYKLLIAYRGTRYHGWQQQAALPTYKGVRPPPGAGIPTIQETLARELAAVVAHPVTIVGSSRTDAGVHAKGQIAHFDTSAIQIEPEGLRRAVNYKLPADILIRSIEPVPDSFDAITAAVSKRYQYFIWNAPDRNPFFPELCWHRWQTLDVPAMQAAAAQFLGDHDFASFSRPDHTRYTTIRTVAGTLVEVGLGKYEPDDMAKMLAAKDRRAAGSTAPPEGLYLQWIKVDSQIGSQP
jgi:tRNA pseudouridine38-40 synthase